MYAAGLRISEALKLRVIDIDSARMTLTINQAKGQKDRYVPMSPRLLTELRNYWSTLLRMHFCRTSDLGKRVYRCDPCNHEATVFNSCGDRNCPQCSGAKRRNWLDSTLSLTIPQATYFQVVFTLPAPLSSLALGNRRAIYELLFETAWAALQRKIEKDL